MKTAVTILLVAAVMAAPVFADFPITQTRYFSGTPNFSETLRFGKLTCPEGLVSIEIKLHLEVTGGYLNVDNDGIDPATLTATFGAIAEVSSSDVTLLDDSFNPIPPDAQADTSALFNLASQTGDGVGDFDPTPPDGAQLLGSDDVEETSGFVNSLFWAGFTGVQTDSFDIEVDVDTVAEIVGAGGVELAYVPPTASGWVEITWMCSGSVPVELTTLTAQSQNGGILIVWQTESEYENLGFQIYRSQGDAGEFELITHDIIPGAGTTQRAQSYEYFDETVEPGNTYLYRITDISYDGIEETHGPIRIAVPLPNGTLTMEIPIPTPARDHFSVRYSIPSSGDVRLSLYDVAGRERHVFHSGLQGAGSYSTTFENASDLGAGMYIVRLIAPGGVLSQPLVITE